MKQNLLPFFEFINSAYWVFYHVLSSAVLLNRIQLTKLLTSILVNDNIYLKAHSLTISKLQTDIF